MYCCDECSDAHGFQKSVTQEIQICARCGVSRPCSSVPDAPPAPPVLARLERGDGSGATELRGDFAFCAARGGGDVKLCYVPIEGMTDEENRVALSQVWIALTTALASGPPSAVQSLCARVMSVIGAATAPPPPAGLPS